MIILIGCQFVGTEVAHACPTCKDGLTNGTAFGYAFSVLFMMGMPFFILSFWTVTIVRLRRLAAQSNDQPKLSDGSSRSELCADRISSSATA